MARHALPLDDAAVVVFADATVPSVHAAILGAWESTKRQLAARGPTWTDEDGEIHRRTWAVVMCEAQEDITVKQRGFLHAAVFPQIAEQVRVDGVRYVAAIWKEHFRKLFLPDVWKSIRMPGDKRATPRRIRRSTEDLGVKAYSEHIDKIIAHAEMEWGVVFVFDQGEREACRYVKPARKAKAAAIEREEVAA